ncbi:formylglycine-generating enzyme family protein [Candidatus Venteria ishoeyi]|uniref:formylglycine-generating enzyme family protein n=1 Tax=Candidatus Venteria ishoeyi TaxID=1899563 RepID=UPI0025A4EDDC|nr:formylglycine-generating enzyme family protein [Candidatus Venteria ishoeyi]MDM8545879.1 formylglycine-generating enzyme family protein [Candidatus Venteria ishoeyi]
MPYFIFPLLFLFSLSISAAESFTNTIGMKFVKVGASKGSVTDDIAAKRRCNPLFFEDCGGGGNSAYPGAIDYPLWVGTTEVTQAQWQKLMGDNPSHFKGDQHPVEQVSYRDAEQFIAKLNQTEPGKHYRLPTEWEWEYAARAGSQADYWWGTQAPVCQKGARNGARFNQCDDSRTGSVKSYQANPFGLYDVHGNVWEWTCSLHKNPYAKKCDASGASGPRVLRGGSWDSDSDYLRLGYRVSIDPDGRNYGIGFRVVFSGLASLPGLQNIGIYGYQ